jgi:hypothetical protein
MRRSRLAVLCGFLGALGVFAAALGPALIHLGAIQPFTGFLVFAVGLLFALLALLVTPFALYRTRASARRTGRGLAWLGFLCGALLVGGVVGSRLPGSDLPRINDIATDLADPPARAGRGDGTRARLGGGLGRRRSGHASRARHLEDLPVRRRHRGTRAAGRERRRDRGRAFEVAGRPGGHRRERRPHPPLRREASALGAQPTAGTPRSRAARSTCASR